MPPEDGLSDCRRGYVATDPFGQRLFDPSEAQTRPAQRRRPTARRSEARSLTLAVELAAARLRGGVDVRVGKAADDRPAAVDVEELPGHVGGLVGGEEERRPHHLLRLAHAA